MQAASKALALQMQNMQEQVADSIAAAATVHNEKQAQAQQLHQVYSACSHTSDFTEQHGPQLEQIVRSVVTIYTTHMLFFVL